MLEHTCRMADPMQLKCQALCALHSCVNAAEAVHLYVQQLLL